MTTVFDVALEKRFTDSPEITSINVTSEDTLIIRDATTGAIMRLPFSTLSSAISSAFSASFASLVDGKVPASQLPSYVDDVLEYANTSAFPATGESGKIYVAQDTNKTYRWSGSSYVEISASPGSTDAVPEGATNLYHTSSRVRDVLLAGLSLASSAVITAADSILTALGKLQAQISLKADDNAVVKLTGNQTVAGAKSFSSLLTVLGSSSGSATFNTSGSTGGASIRGISATNIGFTDLEATPGDPALYGVQIRMFRASTALDASLGIYKGDGTGTLNHRLYGNGGSSYLCANNGNLIVGQSAVIDANSKVQVAGAGIFTGPLRRGQYTLATLPNAATYNGYTIDVTDATGGPKTCRSNGTNWLILNTNTVVS